MTERPQLAGSAEAALGPEPEPDTSAARRRTVGGGASLVLVSQVGIAGSSWLTGVVVARALGPQGAGAFNVVMTLFLALMTLSTLGLTFGVSYYVSHREWAPSAALRQTQLAALLMGAAAATVGMALVIAAGGSAFRGIPREPFVIALAALPGALSWSFTSYLALAIDHYRMYVLGAGAQAIGSVVLAAALAPTLGLEGAVAAASLAAVTGAIVPLTIGIRELEAPPGPWLRQTAASLRRAIRFGIKSHAAVALQFFNLRLDLFVLNATAAAAKVGHYSVAISITNVVSLLPRALSFVVFPRVASLDATAREDERDMVTVKSVRHTILIVAVSGLALVGLMAAIPLVYGSRFAPAVPLGLVLVPGVSALGLSANLSSIIVGRGRPEYALYTALLVTPPTIVLYFIVVPATGPMGAAITSTASYAANLGVTLFFFRRTTGMRLARQLLPGSSELADYRALVRRAWAARPGGGRR